MLKGAPFRVGTSSFVLVDHLLPNVEWLAGKVDDIQILLLEPEGDVPGPAVIARLDELAHSHDMTYTVHLPHLLPEATDAAERNRIVAHLADLVSPLRPLGYVVHLDPHAPQDAEARARWVERSVTAVQQLAGLIGEPVRRIEVENQLERDLPAFREVAEKSGCSLCLDLGHVLAAGGDPHTALTTHLDVTSHVHLHGVADRDHRALEHYPGLTRTLGCLDSEKFSGVLTLEVFGLEAFEGSMATLQQAWQQR